MADAADRSLLGGLTPAAFLRRHWQKRALLVRDAIPGFSGLLSRAELFRLAGRDDVESRLVLRERGTWSLAHGPFRGAHFRTLPARGWTLLVQGVNLHLGAGDALMRRFAFIPYARLDDLMVSYATPGGGVGPHFDSYDVFLLQGDGRRRWRTSRQRDLALKPALPLKILAPVPAGAARGRSRRATCCTCRRIARTTASRWKTCTTYSIGFRAPSAQQLATAFLDWLRDHIALDGRYADPDLRPAREPARIGAAMRAQCAARLAGIRWDRTSADIFLGCHLTEPKATVFFAPPAQPLTPRAFAAAAARRGVRLDARTQLLYDERRVFINGAAMAWPQTGARALERLANARRLRAGARWPAAPAALLYRWYCDGFVHLD